MNQVHFQVLCCTGWLFECFSIWPMGTKILSSPLRLPLYVAMEASGFQNDHSPDNKADKECGAAAVAQM